MVEADRFLILLLQPAGLTNDFLRLGSIIFSYSKRQIDLRL